MVIMMIVSGYQVCCHLFVIATSSILEKLSGELVRWRCCDELVGLGWPSPHGVVTAVMVAIAPLALAQQVGGQNHPSIVKCWLVMLDISRLMLFNTA